MNNDLTFGVRLDGSSSTLVSETKAARDEFAKLQTSTEDLAATSARMSAGATSDYAKIQKSLNDMAIAEDNARDKAWALANGYKDVGGVMVKASADIEEGMAKSEHSTVGFRREVMVLGHEMMQGNFSKVPGSMMVLAERSNMSLASIGALGGVAVGAAAAIGVMGFAMYEGAKEAEEMNRALAMTGDYSGQTESSLRALAVTLSDTTQLTIGQSKQMATALAASGKIGADAFDGVAGAIAAYARASGESEAKVTPMMLKLFADPAKGAAELNSTMHFLDATQLEHIATLEREGQVTQAQVLLADLLSEKLRGQQQEVGILSSSWHSLGKAASSAWDAMMSVGRENTLDEQLKSAQEKLARAAQQAAAVGGENAHYNTEKANAEIAVTFLLAAQKKEAADASAKSHKAEVEADDIATLALAKQNSELWKQFQIKEQIARVSGTDMPTAPTDDAIKQDAVGGLDKKLAKNDGSAKLLADAKRFDDQMLASHEDAFSKEITKWKEKEDALVALGSAGAAQRQLHEAAYTQFVNDETDKRTVAADKAQAIKDKHLVAQLESEDAYFAKLEVSADQSNNSAAAREDKRFADENIAFQKFMDKAQNDHVLSTTEVEKFQVGIDNVLKAHEIKRQEILNAELQNENAYFAQLDQAANASGNTVAAREEKRYQAEISAFAKRYTDAKKQHDLTLAEEVNFQQAMLDIATIHEANRRAMKDDSDREIVNGEIRWKQISLASSEAFFGMAKGLMNSHSHAMFEIGKAAAISEAVIHTYSAATKAFDAMAGIPYVGPVLGAVAAAAAIASGMAQVSAIQATSFGGSSSGGGSYGGANSSTGGGQATPTYPSTPMANSPSVATTPPAQPVNVYIQGNVLTTDFINNTVIPQIKDQIANADVTIIDPRSRQAQMLAGA